MPSKQAKFKGKLVSSSGKAYGADDEERAGGTAAAATLVGFVLTAEVIVVK